MLSTVTVLGDSRAFDTYYTNSSYALRYGYDSTFPHLWRRQVFGEPSAGYDVVHIPDHFRGGTVQNNIVRIALTNPNVVVILDGIWETLLNKGHFLDFTSRSAQQPEQISDQDLNRPYSPRYLVDLFKSNLLSVSPKDFAERAYQLISYFRRRQRQIIWMTLPVPPKSYIGSTYHAGDYQPISDWDECLEALNEAVSPVLEAYQCDTVDMTHLMNEFGGPNEAFIDQWHFSPAFHARIADELDHRCRALLPKTPSSQHVSHSFMLGKPETDLPDTVVIYTGEVADELTAFDQLNSEQILVYPTELEGIDNPIGSDRAEFEKQSAK